MQPTSAHQLCDCSTIQVTDAPVGLALHSRSRHVQRKLQVVLASLEVTFHVVGDALHLVPHAYPQLPAVIEALTPTELSDVQAAPADTTGMVSPWAAQPLAAWAGRLRTPWFSVACQHLTMHLQPIVDLRQGEIFGYEALLRARHEEQLLGAGQLLQAAEAHGQLRALDALARTTAIEQAYPLLPTGAHLFINFAPGVVYNPDVCLQTTFAACRRSGADFHRLVFEVTESESFPDLDLLRRILDRYRSEGALVALDDLGAGHASLSYLAQLQPDIVKLDRGLIRGLSAHDPRCDLLGALVRYAHQLNVRVVAEGVETAAELALVAELGVDYAQGFFLARPAAHPEALSADSLEVLMDLAGPGNRAKRWHSPGGVPGHS